MLLGCIIGALVTAAMLAVAFWVWLIYTFWPH